MRTHIAYAAPDAPDRKRNLRNPVLLTRYMLKLSLLTRSLLTRYALLVMLMCLACLLAAPAGAQTFDRASENQRYQQWLEDFRQDFQKLRRSPGMTSADIDAAFAKTLVPGSRATQLIGELARAPGGSTHGEIHFVGIARVFLAALSDAVVAGDGGVFPDPLPKYQGLTLHVRYVHVDGGGRLERYFNNPDNFSPYRLPAQGELARGAYPFLLFEDTQGKLRLGGVSKEFWDLVKFMDALQYA